MILIALLITSILILVIVTIDRNQIKKKSTCLIKVIDGGPKVNTYVNQNHIPCYY